MKTVAEDTLRALDVEMRENLPLQEAFQRGQDAIDLLQSGRVFGDVDLIVALRGQATRLGLEGQIVKEQTAYSYAQMLAILVKEMKNGEQIQGISPTADDLECLRTQAQGAAQAFIDEKGAHWTNYQTKLFLKKAICGK